MTQSGTINLFYTVNDRLMSVRTWERLMADVPEMIREKCFAYKKWRDRQACLFGKLLLIDCLKLYRHPEKKILEYRAGPFGKPYIPDCMEFISLIENEPWTVQQVALDHDYVCHVASAVKHSNMNLIFAVYYGCE